jgi:hypothetical protein
MCTQEVQTVGVVRWGRAQADKLSRPEDRCSILALAVTLDAARCADGKAAGDRIWDCERAGCAGLALSAAVAKPWSNVGVAMSEEWVTFNIGTLGLRLDGGRGAGEVGRKGQVCSGLAKGGYGMSLSLGVFMVVVFAIECFARRACSEGRCGRQACCAFDRQDLCTEDVLRAVRLAEMG